MAKKAAKKAAAPEKKVTTVKRTRANKSDKDVIQKGKLKGSQSEVSNIINPEGEQAKPNKPKKITVARPGADERTARKNLLEDIEKEKVGQDEADQMLQNIEDRAVARQKANEEKKKQIRSTEAADLAKYDAQRAKDDEIYSRPGQWFHGFNIHTSPIPGRRKEESKEIAKQAWKFVSYGTGAPEREDARDTVHRLIRNGAAVPSGVEIPCSSKHCTKTFTAGQGMKMITNCSQEEGGQGLTGQHNIVPPKVDVRRPRG